MARPPVGGVEHRYLPFKFIDAAIYQRASGKKGRVVVEVARDKVVGPIDDDVVTREQRNCVVDSHALRVRHDFHEWIRGLQTTRGGIDFRLPDGGRVVQELALQIVFLHVIKVRDSNRPDTRRGEIKRGRAAKSARSDDQHAGGGKFLLAGHSNLLEQNMPAVTRHFSGREGGQRINHDGETEPEPGGSQLKLRHCLRPGGMGAMRCLGIDYGARRIGLSYGDELGVATPLPAIVDADEAKRWASLVAVIVQRKITDIVMGYPLNMDGTAGFKAKEVEAFAARLRDAVKLPVHLVDERLTSYEAESTIAKSNRRQVRASGIIDSRAATIVLQDYLNLKIPREAEGGEET